MRKSIKLAVAASLVLSATSAFATNGSNLIGMGTKSRAMGGISIGKSHGSQSAVSNAALITSIKDTEVSFGGTVFMPNVTNTNNLGMGYGTRKSEADKSVIPEVSVAGKVTDNFYTGVGIWGTAGMGVDYRRGNAGYILNTAAVSATNPLGMMPNTGGQQMQMSTNLQLMQFGVPLVFTASGFSLAFTPVVQYGSLDIDYNMLSSPTTGMTFANTGKGTGQDLQFGYKLGLAYSMKGLTIGAIYNPEISMDYQGVLSTTLKPFTGNTYFNDRLSTPKEYGIGLSYAFGSSTVAFDAKKIKWASADGYKDFGWDDQRVYAVGYEFANDKFAFRLGYNWGSSPIDDLNGMQAAPGVGLNGATKNTLNLLGFPGTIEKHYTVGGSVNFTKAVSLDLAYVYGRTNTETFTNAATSTSHNQDSVSAAVNINF